MNDHHLFILLTLFAVLTSSQSYGAGFDCGNQKKLTSIERDICSNSELSKLDAELAKIYREKLKSTLFPEALRQEQKVWIEERNWLWDVCEDYECLVRLDRYRERIIDLKSRAERCDNQVKPSGEFSGNWVSVGYWSEQGKRTIDAYNLVQAGNIICGNHDGGVVGGHFWTGSVYGISNSQSSAKLLICTDSNEEGSLDCVPEKTYSATVTGNQLVINYCSDDVKKCNYKPTILYRESYQACKSVKPLPSTCPSSNLPVERDAKARRPSP